MVFKVENIERFQQAFAEAPRITIEEIGYALEKSARIVEGEAIRQAPFGATGFLRDSIGYELRPLEASVFSIAKYAPYVHEGTRPHYPPIRALKDWARRKLGDENLAFPIARAISRRGTKGQPFLKSSVEKHKSDIVRFFNEALGKIVERIATQSK